MQRLVLIVTGYSLAVFTLILSAKGNIIFLMEGATLVIPVEVSRITRDFIEVILKCLKMRTLFSGWLNSC